MNPIRTIYNIARADLLERTRQFTFLITLGVTVMAAYFFLPPADSGYRTLSVGGYRGIYNSAWVGASIAISTTLFLTLFGFYLVKNSLQRDEQSGFGQIIAASPVSRLRYLLGKFSSNFAVLSMILAVVIVMAAIMQWIRGEASTVEPWPLIAPSLFLTLPILALVSALSIWFEACKPLRGAFGNVIFFVMYISFFSLSLSNSSPFGTSIITDQISAALSALHPDLPGPFGVGIITAGDGPVEVFEWQGMHWTWTLVRRQLSLFLWAVAPILAAALLFRRFQEPLHGEDSGVEQNEGTAEPAEQGARAAAADAVEAGKDEGNEADTSGEAPPDIAVVLAPATAWNAFLIMVSSEWRLMMKGTAPKWYVGAGLLLLLGLNLPLSASMSRLIWPLTWIWPLALWSGMGSREYRYQTTYLIASSPRFVSRQLAAVWCSGFMLTCLTGSGILIRLLLEGDAAGAGHWLSAALLIPSLALATGVLTRTSRAFEVLYMLIWYLGPVNKVPYLDFMVMESADGTSWASGIGIHPWLLSLIYFLVSCGLLGLAYMGRKRMTRSI
ncbi:ABC transporter permease ['Paenibacillus yunnanensis' Narsing Rao et al. 2020]|uniref:ABC transporter permease n=1 Tax=Paenibacillus tengchongensis TaxID=2608684 RepID=UPI001651CC70|nr:ABC-2 transporter permease [Paenibacillus tengchongensis]